MNQTDRRRLLGANIRALRHANGLTQHALATLMRPHGHEWDENTVGKIEAGARRIDLIEAHDLLAVLGLDPRIHLPALLETDGRRRAELQTKLDALTTQRDRVNAAIDTIRTHLARLDHTTKDNAS